MRRFAAVILALMMLEAIPNEWVRITQSDGKVVEIFVNSVEKKPIMGMLVFYRLSLATGGESSVYACPASAIKSIEHIKSEDLTWQQYDQIKAQKRIMQ